MPKDPRFIPRNVDSERKENPVQSNQILNNSITKEHIQNGAITTEKLATSAVTSDKTAFTTLTVGNQQIANQTDNNTVTSINPLWSIFEVRGNKQYLDETFSTSSNNISVYNNNGGSAVTHTRKNTGFIDSTASPVPNNSGYVIEIRHAPTESLGTSPNYGGWYFGITVSTGRQYICVFTMKIPIGRQINWHSNSIGANGVGGWLTNNSGTGKYETYVYYVTAGTTTPASTMFFSVSGGDTSVFYTYLANATVYDTTDTSTNRTRSLYTTEWFRSYGNSGWYSESYGGGIYMIDSTWVRTYGSKNFYCDQELRANRITTEAYIQPSAGSGSNGIIFPSDPGGGGGDTAYIKYYPYAGESCFLDVGITNDALDFVRLVHPTGYLQVGNYRARCQDIGSRGTTGNIIITPDDSIANARRMSGYIEWISDAGYIGTNYFLSDISKKTNIEKSNENANSIIKQIEFISFDWKPESGSTGHIKVGISAQQMQTLDSNFVRKLPDDTLMIHEPSLIPYLGKAIQEQQEIIETQKNQILSLEERIKRLEDLLK